MIFTRNRKYFLKPLRPTYCFQFSRQGRPSLPCGSFIFPCRDCRTNLGVKSYGAFQEISALGDTILFWISLERNEIENSSHAYTCAHRYTKWCFMLYYRKCRIVFLSVSYWYTKLLHKKPTLKISGFKQPSLIFTDVWLYLGRTQLMEPRSSCQPYRAWLLNDSILHVFILGPRLVGQHLFGEVQMHNMTSGID